MPRRLSFLILTSLVLFTPVFLSAQQDPAGLEQVSPEELQQLQDVIQSLGDGTLYQPPVSEESFNLDLLWKADTLVPYDYPGKALPGANSFITVYALADVPAPERLTYSWIVEDASSYREGPDLVGRGQDVFTWFTFIIPGYTHRIKVTVEDTLTGRSASARLTLTTVRPEVRLYRANNNVFNNLSPRNLDLSPGQETSLLTRAFYFNTTSLNDLNLNWYVDNKPAEDARPRPEILPIKITERTPPGREIDLRLETRHKKLTKDINQRATVRVDINIK